MKRLGWGVVAGLGLAGLLVAAPLAYAEGAASGESKTSDDTSMGTSTGSAAGEAGTGTAMSGKELTGTVEKFDQSSKELKLTNSDKKLKVSDSTQVTKDGQKASLSDIKEGDQVRASYSGSGDTLEVITIEVMGAGTTGTGSTEMQQPKGSTEPAPSGQ